MLCDCVVLRDHSFLSFFWCVFLSFSQSLHGLWYSASTTLRSIPSQAIPVYSIHVYMNMNVYFHVICFALIFLVCHYNGVLPVAALLLVHRSLSVQSMSQWFHEQWPLRSHFNSTSLYTSICPFVVQLFDFTKKIASNSDSSFNNNYEPSCIDVIEFRFGSHAIVGQ